MSISGPPLSRPVPVTGLVGHYPTNSLIGRSPILERQKRSMLVTPLNLSFQRGDLSRISLSFPGLSPSQGQVDYVLLSRTLRLHRGDVRLAWLNLNPIAVGSSRINWSRLSGVGYALLRS